MKESVILVVAPAAAVVIILLWKARIAAALRRRRHPPEELAAEIHARLSESDWTFYERHLQRPVPAALRELYSDVNLLMTSASYRGKGDEINSFEPLNEHSLLDTRKDMGFDIVPIATSVCGDPIYLKPGAKETNAVYIAYHDDPGNIKIFAESVDALVRHANQANSQKP